MTQRLIESIKKVKAKYKPHSSLLMWSSHCRVFDLIQDHNYYQNDQSIPICVSSVSYLT